MTVTSRFSAASLIAASIMLTWSDRSHSAPTKPLDADVELIELLESILTERVDEKRRKDIKVVLDKCAVLKTNEERKTKIINALDNAA